MLGHIQTSFSYVFVSLPHGVRVAGDKRVQRIQKGPARHRTDDVAKDAVPLDILDGNGRQRTAIRGLNGDMKQEMGLVMSWYLGIEGKPQIPWIYIK